MIDYLSALVLAGAVAAPAYVPQLDRNAAGVVIFILALASNLWFVTFRHRYPFSRD